MEIGTMLAALDNNHNTGRGQKRTILRSNKGRITVKNHFRIAYRKPMKKFIARKLYERKQYLYLKDMMHEARLRAENGCAYKLIPTKRKHMAPTERDSRNDLISRSIKYGRFK